ncbi:cyclic nucleotide-binding/CBS domain-containing protein [Legionella dresdenensis]|uniref:Cyclic nucleotide-binding/CBS domain-containing protein n=1 Tax=Legionella dresdenensis TaxID=450200 RepID=A0ABV8CCN3_9GAMM
MAELIYSALSNPRRPIVYVDPQLSVTHCVNLMIRQDVGALVVHDDKRLLGMVTERDIVRSCINQHLDPDVATAGDIAYTDVSILTVDMPVEAAMEVITKTKRRHVLIEENGILIAVLSIGDLLFHILESKQQEIKHLENYIHT